MKVLVVSEKPSVAARIAAALGEGRAKRMTSRGGVSYYRIEGKDETYVVAAVGHLYTIAQSGKERNYPVLDIGWQPSYLASKASSYTKKYLDVVEDIAPKCDMFVNACDFDVEGTVIGTNIIRILGKPGNAKRMKFSTTTAQDLTSAYSSLMPLDMRNFQAGEARHMLDWLWGINLSRALTRAVFGWNISKTNSLSIGRVQGPALSILVKRELDIQKFVEKPFWRVVALVSGIEFLNARGDIFERRVAESALADTRNNSSGTIESVDSVDKNLWPYPPFDLTALQLEASRALHLDPSKTLALAQSLYERSYISYPRTSSQKLPQSLGLKSIITELAKNRSYKEYAELLIAQGRFKPLEGKKQDEAHPAIFPTGVHPSSLTAEEAKLYDLIVRRFLSCFAEPALVKRAKVTARFGGELYSVNGATILKKGWLDMYPFTKVAEKELPRFEKGSAAAAEHAESKELKTQPPKRYTKAGLIAELEKRELGTKATRAGIIDTLLKRGYATGQSLTATKFGMSIFETLDKDCSMIVNDETTRKLEEDMEAISRGKRDERDVIEEGKRMLLDALNSFDEHKDDIAARVRAALKESVPQLGKCPKCGGDLVIRRSRFGKNFVACNNYPKCTNTYSLPQGALIEPTGRACEHCHTPIIKVIRRGRRPFEMDLDPMCVSKKDWNSTDMQSKVVTASQLDKEAEEDTVKTAAGKTKPRRKASAARAKPRPKAAKAKPKGKRTRKKSKR